MLKRLLVTFLVVAVCTLATTTNAVGLRQVEAGVTDTTPVSAGAPEAPIVTQPSTDAGNAVH